MLLTFKGQMRACTKKGIYYLCQLLPCVFVYGKAPKDIIEIPLALSKSFAVSLSSYTFQVLLLVECMQDNFLLHCSKTLVLWEFYDTCLCQSQWLKTAITDPRGLLWFLNSAPLRQPSVQGLPIFILCA